MPRYVRTFVADLLALTFGFAVVSFSTAALTAARSSNPMRTAVPAASVLSPSQGQIVSGNVIVSATASLDTEALQFQLSGSNLGPAITVGACSLNWNTAAVGDGTYALTVLASDAGGNMTSSGSVAVTVANNAPQITNVATSAPTSSSVMITWTTNQVSTSGVDYGVDALTSSLPIDFGLVTQHMATLSGLAPGTSYRFSVTSYNGAGLRATSAEFTFATAPGDPTAPAVPPPDSGGGGIGGGIGGGVGGGFGGYQPPAPSPVLPPPPPPTEPVSSAPPPPAPSSSPAPAPPAPAPSDPTTIDSVAVDPALGVLANVVVILERDGRAAAMDWTDPDGKFRFTGLIPGRYQVWAWYNLARILVLDVTLRAPEPKGHKPVTPPTRHIG